MQSNFNQSFALESQKKLFFALSCKVYCRFVIITKSNYSSLRVKLDFHGSFTTAKIDYVAFCIWSHYFRLFCIFMERKEKIFKNVAKNIVRLSLLCFLHFCLKVKLIVFLKPWVHAKICIISWFGHLRTGNF